MCSRWLLWLRSERFTKIWVIAIGVISVGCTNLFRISLFIFLWVMFLMIFSSFSSIYLYILELMIFYRAVSSTELNEGILSSSRWDEIVSMSFSRIFLTESYNFGVVNKSAFSSRNFTFLLGPLAFDWLGEPTLSPS